MRRTLLLLAGLLIGFAPAPFPRQQRPDAASQRDLQAMQGEWTERFADSAAVTIIGDRMVHTSDYEWKLTLNGKTTPKRIKAVGVGPRLAGKTRLGIYRLEKDRIIICWRRGSAGKLDWPANLDLIQKDVWVEVFTRVKQ
jgi:uncharacterized protein (TIGR03067 family)